MMPDRTTIVLAVITENGLARSWVGVGPTKLDRRLQGTGA